MVVRAFVEQTKAGEGTMPSVPETAGERHSDGPWLSPPSSPELVGGPRPWGGLSPWGRLGLLSFRRWWGTKAISPPNNGFGSVLDRSRSLDGSSVFPHRPCRTHIPSTCCQYLSHRSEGQASVWEEWINQLCKRHFKTVPLRWQIFQRGSSIRWALQPNH